MATRMRLLSFGCQEGQEPDREEIDWVRLPMVAQVGSGAESDEVGKADDFAKMRVVVRVSIQTPSGVTGLRMPLRLLAKLVMLMSGVASVVVVLAGLLPPLCACRMCK